ncbi:MAG: M42 family metallopeptidase [Anaerolineae bacterium]|nr:M42 family metallopeptidase [Anaerolineae bacterium]
MDIAFLQTLSEARGVSGDEGEVRGLLARSLKGTVDELRTDTIGNLIALRRGTGRSSLRVMVVAHMDEVGLMVTGADANGFLRFQPVGGIDPRVLLANRVLVGKDRIPGIIGVKPVHLTEPSERKNVIRADQLYIDIGAKNKDEALGAAPMGEYVTFDTPFHYLQGCRPEDRPPVGRASGKAFDDRAGCFVLASLLEHQFDFDLYGVFSVQEEVGLRGAKTAAYAVAPTLAFALEGTVCDDSPKEDDVSPTTVMGRGPAVTVADASVISDRRLVDLLVQTALGEGIPYQIKQPNIGGTDAGAVHLQREGIPSVAVAVPCRYLHSPESVLDLLDLHHAVRLMEAALRRLPEAWTSS